MAADWGSGEALNPARTQGRWVIGFVAAEEHLHNHLTVGNNQLLTKPGMVCSKFTIVRNRRRPSSPHACQFGPTPQTEEGRMGESLAPLPIAAWAPSRPHFLPAGFAARWKSLSPCSLLN